jgi:hypothetical protein
VLDARCWRAAAVPETGQRAIGPMLIVRATKLVLPDRIELRFQSPLALILLRFSVRRSVFVWHSWVALLLPQSTLQGARFHQVCRWRCLGLPQVGWPEHIHPLGRNVVDHHQRRPGSHERFEADAELKLMTDVELVEVISFVLDDTLTGRATYAPGEFAGDGGERVALPKELGPAGR